MLSTGVKIALRQLGRELFGAHPRKLDYHRYLASPEWHQRAEEAKVRAGHRCQVCNSPEHLEAHHRTYERLGHELPMDLTVLCEKCHELFSRNGRLAK